MDFVIPNFNTDKELFDFLVKNEADIHYAKKQTLKRADAISVQTVNVMDLKTFGSKASTSTFVEKDSIEVIAVINTTKLLDSHRDVHIDGLWDKSLSENKNIKFLQEHVMSFKNIIADKDDLEAYTKEYTWKELGYDAEGKTQALVFKATIRKSRNEFMFNEYAKGNVDNHSVGMRYVKLATCICDEDYPEQFENWEKYAPLVANKAELERIKYFFAVTEAKAIEGSAVPMGSNFVTPTQSVKAPVTESIESKRIQAIKGWLLDN